MDNRVLTPDDARERIDAWKGRIDKLAADTKAMSDQFQALEVTRRDRDGMVEVTVDSSGSLVALRLTREIERASPDVLAGTIMSTIRDAKTELAARSQEIIEDTVGTESPAARAIAERVGEHLLGGRAEVDAADDEEQETVVAQDVHAEDRQAPRPGTRPARDDRDDEDNDDLNIWR